jgi:hypothetical protein
MRWLIFAWSSILAVSLVGCSDTPRAPTIVQEAIYQNDRIGLQFATPEGWLIQTKTDLPAGVLPKPVLLVSYLCSKGEGLQLQVEAANSVPDAEVESFLTNTPAGESGWKIKEPQKAIAVRGVPAIRLLLKRTSSKHGELLKEVIVFQRAERTYFFSILYSTSDRAVRDQANQSIQSIVWN